MPAKKSRKRRTRGAAARGATAARPRAVTSTRREERAERQVVAARERRAGQRQTGTLGERPPSPFGGLPISELAIFVGGIGLVVGLIEGGGVALIVGVVVCALGVLEVTTREHFSGFRSHSTLLAAFPAVAVEVVLVLAVGKPRQSGGRALLLLAVAPVFGGCFWFLRKRFDVARQARLARPPAP